MNKEKIEKGESRYEKEKNSAAFKQQPRRKEALKEKIEKRRKSNLKKINKIKVKKYKQ